MKQGEIWLVCYDPSVGHEYKKSRPAIIISSHSALPQSPLVTVMAVTSKVDGLIGDDIEILKDQANRLWSDSVIKTSYISSFDPSRFIKRIGLAHPKILEKIKECLLSYFGINAHN